ncbi:MAG TPA: ABC transporter ATP-binding protein [Solirubrobacteraceae bacterium]|jgi:ABC-2 type transport system ATP-binding protein|nr:ABC transporter ATP-binding protein [Solirubrobacteraceae bacterium]
MSDTAIIETSGLTKRFGQRVAVDGVSLSVPRGCAYGFLGHNGAGKTTTIRMLLGLTRPDAGTMHLRGLAVPAQRREALSRVGAIVEEPSFHRHLTGVQNLRMLAAVRGPETFARIDGALERVGLTERANELVSRYSQGMRQRLGVARCLLADPELLILDEPTNGLDPAGILEFRQMIRAFIGEGRTVFLSSHLLDEVEKTCEAAAIIDAGRIVTAGPIAELARARRAELIIECDDRDRALELLAGSNAVLDAEREPGGLRLTLRSADLAAELNTLLVEAGISVSRLEPVRSTLEERFLEVTSRLQSVA